MSKVLIIEDEVSIAELEKDYLELSGFDVEIESDGARGLEKALASDFDMYILDLMLPGMDGFEICKRIREVKNTPILMVSAKKDDIDKIRGLGLGADDYITKPFSVRELLARVKAVLRRFSVVEPESSVLVFGNLKADFEKREIHVKDKKLDLTLKEFELLEILIRNKGKILTRDTLLDKIWGYEYIGETRTVDVHIRYLRKKIEADDKNPKLIETIRGVGYRFNPN